MTKKWIYIEDKIPDNEDVGTLFEIIFYTDKGVLVKDRYKVVEFNNSRILESLEMDVEMPLISNWLEEYNIAICLEDKWRYITDNELMAYL